MASDSKSYDPPPPYDDDAADEPAKDILEPVILVLDSQSVHAETASSTPLYRMGRSVTTDAPRDGSSVVFERVEHDVPEKEKGIANPRNQHLFYLAHPANAQYRTDLPAYYITSVSPEMTGNIRLETSKPLLQKTSFTALLSAKRSASDKPLFDEKAAERSLFHVKPNWKGDQYKWTDSDGRQVAFEDGKDDQHRLVVTASMDGAVRDALVAVWVLRLWYDTAESKQAKREALESMMPPVVHSDMKLAKRAGALGAGAAGAGGGG